MILRPRSSLIKKAHALPIHPHPLAPKPQIPHHANVIAVVILDEKRQAADAVEEGALDGMFLELGGAGQGERLGRLGGGGGDIVEVEVVAVEVDVEGLGGGGGGRG